MSGDGLVAGRHVPEGAAAAAHQLQPGDGVPSPALREDGGGGRPGRALHRRPTGLQGDAGQVREIQK